ncbi:MAG: hypothetical protein ABIW33_01120 [Sphingomicrobium sp.]
MNVTFEMIANDPALYLFALQGDMAHFQQMTRETFRRSIFLDDRIVRAGGQGFSVPFNEIRAADWPEPANRPVQFIFHVAQCGSTLLARALDLPGRSLVLREPAALRRLGVEAGQDGKVDGQMLDFTLAMLGKRWDAAAPVVVKANVPVNAIVRDIRGRLPGASALCLYFPLAGYVAAVMRTPGHEQWVESIFAEMHFARSPWAAQAAPRSTAQRAACLWFAQIKGFDALTAADSAARTLNADVFFDHPAETITQTARLFGIALSRVEADDIVAGELFATYSKNPALDYDAEVRAARALVARRSLAAEIAEAEAWARAARDRHGLSEALDSPLFGDRVPLLG